MKIVNLKCGEGMPKSAAPYHRRHPGSVPKGDEIKLNILKEIAKNSHQNHISRVKMNTLNVEDRHFGSESTSKWNSKPIKFSNFREFCKPKPCGTSFVKYRHQLSPKYLKLYKEKERRIKEIDKSLSYHYEKPLNEFDAKISGVNCTIPTKWIANRFRSTTSSAFVLTTVENKDESPMLSANFISQNKIIEKSLKNLNKRTIPLKNKDIQKQSDSSINKNDDSNMRIDVSKKSRIDLSMLEEPYILKPQKFDFEELNNAPQRREMPIVSTPIFQDDFVNKNYRPMFKKGK